MTSPIRWRWPCRLPGWIRRRATHRPRLLSDNGSSYVSGDLAKWLERQDMRHTRGAPYHPMTQGKIERWHQTLKNRILLENVYPPGDLEAQIDAFVAYYNHRRYHESIDNLTPADVYFGRGQTIRLKEKGSNAKPSKAVGCFTTNKPHRHQPRCARPSLKSGRLLSQNI